MKQIMFLVVISKKKFHTAKFTAWLINCTTKTCTLIVLLSAGVFLLAYKNAIHFLERQLDMAIEIERRVCLFSLTAFFRFTETYALRIQSANPNFDEEKQKVHNKDPKKCLINNDKKSRR